MEIMPHKLLVIDALSHTVLIVDGPSGEILAEIPLPTGFSPIDLVVSPDFSHALISLAGSSGRGSLRVLNLHSFAFDRRSPDIPYPAHFAPAPDEAKVYLADSSGALYVLDNATLALETWGKPAGSGCCVGLASDSSRLYSVWEKAAGGVLAVFSHSGELLQEYAIGGIPTSLTLDRQGRIFIPFTATAFSGEGVFILPEQKNGGMPAVVTLQCSRCSAFAKAYPAHVAISSDSKLAYIACEDSATIGVIDLATASLCSSIPLGRSVSRLVLIPDGKFAVASSNAFADLCLIDLVNSRLVSFTATKRELLSPLAVIY